MVQLQEKDERLHQGMMNKIILLSFHCLLFANYIWNLLNFFKSSKPNLDCTLSKIHELISDS